MLTLESSSVCLIETFLPAERRYVRGMKTILFLMTFCALVCVARADEPKAAQAQLDPKSDTKVTGLVFFIKKGDDVQVAGNILNLKPGKHGVHIHDKGDCSAPDASSAGPHFNPTNKHHGGPTTAEHHTGDLGNIEAGADGTAQINWKGKLSLSGGDSIIGKSLVVHDKEDDLKTDPAGNSGARVACGVITEAK